MKVTLPNKAIVEIEDGSTVMVAETWSKKNENFRAFRPADMKTYYGLLPKGGVIHALPMAVEFKNNLMYLN
jgi:hypothetical protein